jgi:hypothetical protein
VVAVEQAKSLEAAADRLRPDIELPGAIRWTRRRVKRVQASLRILVGLLRHRRPRLAFSEGLFMKHPLYQWVE